MAVGVGVAVGVGAAVGVFLTTVIVKLVMAASYLLLEFAVTHILVLPSLTPMMIPCWLTIAILSSSVL